MGELDDVIAQRTDILKDFPHSITLSADYQESDVAKAWCWEHFGEINVAKCTEYLDRDPVCPIAKKAHEVRKVGNFYSPESIVVDGVSAVNHSHTGNWTIAWYGKLDYDYGFCEFFFKDEKDAATFRDAIPTLS